MTGQRIEEYLSFSGLPPRGLPFQRQSVSQPAGRVNDGGELKGRKQSARDLRQRKHQGKEEGTKRGGWGWKKCGEGRLTIGGFDCIELCALACSCESQCPCRTSEPTNRQNKARGQISCCWRASDLPDEVVGWTLNKPVRVCVCVCPSSKHTVWIHERAESPSPWQALVKWRCYNMITRTIRSVFPKQCLPRLFPG